MTTYGRLEQKNNGAFDLPLVEEFTGPVDVRVGDVVHGKAIWNLWSNDQLNAEGLTKIEDVTQVVAGKERASASSDVFEDGYVKRTYALVDVSPDGLKQQLLRLVNDKRAQITQAGVAVTVRGNGHILQTDNGSQQMLVGAMAAAAANHTFPSGFSWRMRDNTDVDLNPAEMKAMAGTVFDHVNAAHAASRIHKAAIEALTTWAELDAYDLDAGWPDVAPPEDVV